MEEAAAITTLSGAGYGNVDVTGQFSSEGAGEIISQEPECGTVVNSSIVMHLVKSLGTLEQAGTAVFATAFNGILTAFAIGIFIGLFIKITNRS